MPLGAEVTVPDPAPVLLTVSRYWLGVNVAVTVLFAVIVTPQGVVPAHALQPVKVEPGSATAVSVTVEPFGKLTCCVVQAVAQLIPAGLEETVPVPPPALFTVSLRFAGAAPATGASAP